MAIASTGVMPTPRSGQRTNQNDRRANHDLAIELAADLHGKTKNNQPSIGRLGRVDGSNSTRKNSFVFARHIVGNRLKVTLTCYVYLK